MLEELSLFGMCIDAVIDTLTAEVISAATEALAGVEIIVVVVRVIGLEFVVEVPYAVNVVAGVPFVSESSIGAEANASGLAAALTALDFALLSPLKKVFLSC